MPWTAARGTWCGARSRASGEVVVGATVEEHDEPAVPTAGGVRRLLAAATELLPGLDRAAVVEVAASEQVRFARTKGLVERRVQARHVARNAAVTIVPYLGVQAVVLVEGVVVVESLFSWQGLGHALVHAVFWRDVPMLQATALVLALLVVAVNTVVDLVGLWLDPRPRALEGVR